MCDQRGLRKPRGPTSDDFARNGSAAGPLRDLRWKLDGRGDPRAPFTQDETAIVFAWLPPRQRSDADDLERARPEIEAFSNDPDSAAAYLEIRLSSPFATHMRDHAEAFAEALPSWFERVSSEMPAPRRVLVLQAALIRLYDAACEARPSEPSIHESFPAAWRRNVP